MNTFKPEDISFRNKMARKTTDRIIKATAINTRNSYKKQRTDAIKEINSEWHERVEEAPVVETEGQRQYKEALTAYMSFPMNYERN